VAKKTQFAEVTQEDQVLDAPTCEDVAVQPATGGGLVIPAQSPGLPATENSVAERRRAAAGLGVSQAVRDRCLPFVKLLQKTSPEVEPGGPGYVEGALFGDILLKNFPFASPIVKGDQGFLFQLAGSEHTWVEWRPKRAGGGIVRRVPMSYDISGQPIPPLGAAMGPHPDLKNKEALISAEGNVLVDTRYVVGNYVGDAFDPSTAIPCLISLTSTGHRFFRLINTFLTQVTMDGRKISAMDRLFLLTTRRRTKDINSWSEWQFEDRGPTSDVLWELGYNLHEQFRSGEKQIDDSVLSDHPLGGDVIDGETGEVLQRGPGAAGRLDEAIPF
jgi:hypothetical protein